MRQEFFSILLSAVWVSAKTNTCAADNCYRDVVANRFPTRNGRADCASYLGATAMATATPSTSTVYTTVTVVATASTTVEQTATTIQSDTLTMTSIIAATETTTATIPQTVTTTKSVPTTFITQVDATSTVVETDVYSTTTVYTNLFKRAAGSPRIPAYASHCSNPSRYISACSCAGVTAATAGTVSTSTTTVTRSTTVTSSTVTVLTTDATQTLVTTVSTETDYTVSIVSTETQTIPTTVSTQEVDTPIVVATQEITSVVTTATVTTSVVATVTSIQMSFPTCFAVFVADTEGGLYNGRALGMAKPLKRSPTPYLAFADLSVLPAIFSFDADGNLLADGTMLSFPTSTCSAKVFASDMYRPNTLPCQIDKTTHELTCRTAAFSHFAVFNNGGTFGVLPSNCSTDDVPDDAKLLRLYIVYM